ncbi:MAG: glycosyltransferase family 2 protein [Chloroflexota bacterium]
MNDRPKVSGVVLALNSAELIGNCLRSLTWTDECIVLVDAATTDNTGELAQQLGARVHSRAFTTFAEQRNAALDLATTEWIMFVDADERVPPRLAEEIRQIIGQRAEPVGYWVPRRNIICGRWIKHAGWYPDRQLRLLRRGKARYEMNLPVHEVAELQGESAVLVEPLLHLNYRSLPDFWMRQRRYARLAAQGMVHRGERPRARTIIGQPLREFLRRFVHEQGYREGPLGLALCLMLAAGTLETYARAVTRQV